MVQLIIIRDFAQMIVGGVLHTDNDEFAWKYAEENFKDFDYDVLSFEGGIEEMNEFLKSEVMNSVK